LYPRNWGSDFLNVFYVFNVSLVTKLFSKGTTVQKSQALDIRWRKFLNEARIAEADFYPLVDLTIGLEVL
jgi:hypothetical protein